MTTSLQQFSAKFTRQVRASLSAFSALTLKLLGALLQVDKYPMRFADQLSETLNSSMYIKMTNLPCFFELIRLQIFSKSLFCARLDPNFKKINYLINWCSTYTLAINFDIFINISFRLLKQDQLIARTPAE